MSGLILEDMDDHISVIYKRPVSMVFAFNTYGPNPFFPQPPLYIAGDCLDLRNAFTGAYDKIIGNCSKLPEIEDYRLFCLFVERRFRCL